MSRGAGVRAIAVLGPFPTEKRLREAKPEFLLEKIEELPELLRTLLQQSSENKLRFRVVFSWWSGRRSAGGVPRLQDERLKVGPLHGKTNREPRGPSVSQNFLSACSWETNICLPHFRDTFRTLKMARSADELRPRSVIHFPYVFTTSRYF